MPVLRPCRRTARVVAVRVDAGVGAEGDLDAGLHGLREVLALDLADRPFLLDRLRGDLELGRLAEDVVVVVDVGTTSQVPCSFISRMPSSSIRLPCSIESTPARIAFLIPWAPCAWAATLRPSRCASSTIALHLLRRVLRRARLSPSENTPAARAHLDDVRAVLDDLAHLGPRLPRPVGDPGLLDVVLEPQEVVVAVAAGDPERGPGHDEPRPGDLAGVDRVAQRDVREAVGADVAHRREPGEKRPVRVGDAVDRLARHRVAERPVAVVGGLPVRWSCISIRPGRSVAPPRSITRAPVGIAAVGPTATIRSFSITTTAGETGGPPRPSTSFAARTTTRVGGGVGVGSAAGSPAAHSPRA